MRRFSVLMFLACLAAATPARALEPGEVAVIYNADFEGSKALAEYYVQKRGIPEKNVLAVHATKDEYVERSLYLRTIETPIRDWLGQEDRYKCLRCLLLIRGVPVAISERSEPALLTPVSLAQRAVRAVENEKTDLEAQKKRLEAEAANDPAHAEELRAKIRALDGTLADIEERLKPLRAERDRTMRAWRAVVGDTSSSVDSELAAMYVLNNPVQRWLPNMLYWKAWNAPGRDKTVKTFMACRLDGPNDAAVKRIIDDSLAAEAKGLDGVAYFDALNMHTIGPGQSGPAVAYDERIRRCAAMVEKTGFKTVLDDRKEVFAPGSCPHAALYWGWYSLERYVPAFKWVPGSVGAHIASFEARSIRDPNTQDWVKRMIDEGIATTFGPIFEPFLNTFPDPVEFCAFLLTGRYQMAEVYWYTVPVDSWMLTLVADPLYTPFKRNPKMTIAQMREALGMPPP